jgi:hypothetical protein
MKVSVWVKSVTTPLVHVHIAYCQPDKSGLWLLLTTRQIDTEEPGKKIMYTIYSIERVEITDDDEGPKLVVAT